MFEILELSLTLLIIGAIAKSLDLMLGIGKEKKRKKR